MTRVVFIPSILVNEEYDIFTDKTKDYLEKIVETVTIYPKTPDMAEQKKMVKKVVKEDDFLIGWSSGANIAYDIFEEDPKKYSGTLLIEATLDWHNSPLEQILLSPSLSALPNYAKKKIGGNKKLIEFTLDCMIETGVSDKEYKNIIEKLQKQGGEWLIDSFSSLRKETRFKNYKQRIKKLDEKYIDKIHWITATKSTRKYAREIGRKNSYEFKGNHMIGYGKNSGKIHEKIKELIPD